MSGRTPIRSEHIVQRELSDWRATYLTGIDVSEEFVADMVKYSLAGFLIIVLILLGMVATSAL